MPGKIGIAGFNDLEMMKVAYPSITSVRTHRYQIGRRAIDMARAALLLASDEADFITGHGLVADGGLTLRT